MSTAMKDSRLNFRLPSELKSVVEQAAAHLGQSVSDFAISELVEKAREIIREHDVTELTNRDRDTFLRMLDQQAEPNAALQAAATLHKKDIREP